MYYTHKIGDNTTVAPVMDFSNTAPDPGVKAALQQAVNQAVAAQQPAQAGFGKWPFIIVGGALLGVALLKKR
jgi:hypothetical protein